jgi:hypothetical protein
MFKSKIFMAVTFSALSNVSLAAFLECPDLGSGFTRNAGFDLAVPGSCEYRDGNTTVSDIRTSYPAGAGQDWVELDQTLISGDTGLITVVFTEGDNPTGDTPGTYGIAGTWTINDANIWNDYSRLAFSTHIGGGSGTPDSWSWLIAPQETSGDFFIEATSQSSWNGFSNAKLYGEVPIPAAAWLFGSGLLGLVGIARRKKA